MSIGSGEPAAGEIRETGIPDGEDPEGIRGSGWMIASTIAATSGLCLGLFLVLLTFIMQLFNIFGNDLGCIDLLVYRAGGHAVLSGNAIYTPDFAKVNHSPNGLPFTYPPFAALIFVPLAVLPLIAAKALMVALNAAACAVFLVLLHRAVRGENSRIRAMVFIAAIAFLLGQPVQSNFEYGQVNLILAAAIAADVLPPFVRWPRGLLVGLAATIKLTPVIFIGYFVVTRQWRAAAVSFFTAAFVSLACWILMPADSVRYFTSLLGLSARVGEPELASNQSLWGIIARNGALDSVRGLVWGAGIVAVLALAAVAVSNFRHGDTAAAMLATALAGLLCSRVSWGHHWVWLSAAAAYFLMRLASSGGMRDLLAGAALTAITVVAPWSLLPSNDGRERLWNPLQHMAGSAWALAAVLTLAAFASTAFRRAPLSLRRRGARRSRRWNVCRRTDGPARHLDNGHTSNHSGCQHSES